MKVRKINVPPDWKHLEAHHYASIIEYGIGIDVEAVSAHMQKIGYDQSEPVILYQGKILMGRHRHSCAISAEVVPSFAEFDGDDEDAIEFVRKDILRRHLDTTQRAMFAAGLANLRNGKHKADPVENDASPYGEADSNTSRSEAAAKMNVSERAVDRASVIEKHGSEKLKTAARKGIVTVSDAEKIARAPKKIQDKAVQDVMDKKARTLAEAAKDYIDETGRVKKKPKKKTERKELKDAAGEVIPDRLRDVFADTALSEMVDSLDQIDAMFSPERWVEKAGKLTKDHPFLLIAKFNEQIFEARHQLQLAVSSLKAGLPHAVCPKCKGEERETPCRSCRGGGHIPEHRFAELCHEPV